MGAREPLTTSAALVESPVRGCPFEPGQDRDHLALRESPGVHCIARPLDRQTPGAGVHGHRTHWARPIGSGLSAACGTVYGEATNGNVTMARVVGLRASAALLLAGCGDDGADSDTTDDTTTGESDVGGSADGQTDEGSEGDVSDLVDDLDFGDGTALVTVGDVDYEFALGASESADGTTYIGACQELFGLITGDGFVAGDPHTTIDFEIPPPDWESYDDSRFDSSEPRIEIELGDDGGWAADLTLATNRPEIEGQSQIDEWTLDDATAIGTATFIEMEPFSAPVDGANPVQGSFEIGCGGG